MRAVAVYAAPFGDLGLEAGERGVARVWLPGRAPVGFAAARGSATAEEHLAAAVSQLTEYFARQRTRFTVPLDWAEAADGFAGEVQHALTEIPYGETVSYGELADRLNRPRAARAVGTACSHNPLPLFAACHRVIRADGSVGDYGAGTKLKRAMLEFEGWRG